MGIVIPRRTNPYTGQPTYTTQSRYDDLMAQYNADQSFQNSFGQGIPGLTSPFGTTTQIPGMTGIAPPQQQFQPPPQQMPSAGFQPTGPYGRQAMGLAGLLSMNNPPGDTYPNGLLGGKRPFRPGGK